MIKSKMRSKYDVLVSFFQYTFLHCFFNGIKLPNANAYKQCWVCMNGVRAQRRVGTHGHGDGGDIDLPRLPRHSILDRGGGERRSTHAANLPQRAGAARNNFYSFVNDL